MKIIKKNLIETILNEDIESMKKFYSNVPEDKFIYYVELDPTYTKGSTNAGTYGKWILGLANKGEIENIGHLTDVLKRFEAEKKHLKNKDILKFKSVQEVEDMLNDDNSYTELSHRQEVRQRQKDRRNVDLGTDAELVYEDGDWEVWIPKTYAASCKLGQGTTWCTASTESDNYYNEYTKEGDLYININKHNPKEKYQFHFESESFMDVDDSEIDIINFLGSYPKLQKFYDKLPIEKPDGWLTAEEAKSLSETGLGIHNSALVKVRKDLKTVTIPDGVTRIGTGAFQDCKSLTSIEIPNSVTSIGDWAFAVCTNLTSIKIPDSVTSIGMGAFAHCTSLTSIKIPDSVTSIGYYAFDECSSLTSIEIGSGVTSIGERAFYGCTSLTSIKIPNSVTKIGGGAFAHCTGLTSINIPNSVTSIGEGAFQGCSSLTSIEIPDSVTSIGARTFFPCTSLTSIKIPDSVTSIGTNAFLGCNNLIVHTDSEYVKDYCKKNGIKYQTFEENMKNNKMENLNLTELFKKITDAPIEIDGKTTSETIEWAKFNEKLIENTFSKKELNENILVADELWNLLDNATTKEEIENVRTSINFSNNISIEDREKLLDEVESKLADIIAYQDINRREAEVDIFGRNNMKENIGTSSLERKDKAKISNYLSAISRYTNKDVSIEDIINPIKLMGFTPVRESIDGWNKMNDGYYRKDYYFTLEGYDDMFMISLYAKGDGDWTTNEINAYFVGKTKLESVLKENTFESIDNNRQSLLNHLYSIPHNEIIGVEKFEDIPENAEEIEEFANDLSAGTGNLIIRYFYDANTDKLYAWADF